MVRWSVSMQSLRSLPPHRFSEGNNLGLIPHGYPSRQLDRGGRFLSLDPVPPGRLTDREDARLRGLIFLACRNDVANAHVLGSGFVVHIPPSFGKDGYGLIRSVLNWLERLWTLSMETEVRLLHFRFFQDFMNLTRRTPQLCGEDAREFSRRFALRKQRVRF